MNQKDQQNTDDQLEQSSRFAPQATRRDFLGIGAICAAIGAFFVATIGAIRLPMPSVFPESNTKVKVGLPDVFPRGSITHLGKINAWVFCDSKGLYAISTICTHLGCIVKRDSKNGSFKCPCHGSVFQADGKVVAGPAPSGLKWLSMSVAPDGQVVIDQSKSVSVGTYL